MGCFDDVPHRGDTFGGLVAWWVCRSRGAQHFWLLGWSLDINGGACDFNGDIDPCVIFDVPLPRVDDAISCALAFWSRLAPQLTSSRVTPWTITSPSTCWNVCSIPQVAEPAAFQIPSYWQMILIESRHGDTFGGLVAWWVCRSRRAQHFWLLGWSLDINGGACDFNGDIDPCVIFDVATPFPPGVDDAISLRLRSGILEQTGTTVDILQSDTMDHYLTFYMLERLLHSPKLLNQLLFQIPSYWQMILIERYYAEPDAKVDDAISLRLRSGILEQTGTTVDILQSDTMDHYLTFYMLERLLHSPSC
ncbi:putative Acidic fibroblast growth factor intracellular-binding protein [Naja naja]|nr:putative Acidic fibroblast growth factor intracellular-binding protein [Naja naja]